MKILIIKTSALGDIVHSFPVVDYLRERFPAAAIDWVVEAPFAGLLKSHPDVRQLFTIDSKKWRSSPFSLSTFKEIADLRYRLRREKYDYVFDLQGNLKSAFVAILCRTKNKVGYGFKTAHEWPNALFMRHRYNPPRGQNARDEYLFLVQSLFNDPTRPSNRGVALTASAAEQQQVAAILAESCLQGREKIMVSPGSNWRNKQLPCAILKDFLLLIAQSRSCSFLLMWGNEQEKQYVEELQRQFPQNSLIVDRLQLPVLQNLMGKVDLVIAMDSLPLHLAATTTTPTYSIFGASSAAKYKPVGAHHHAYQGSCPYGRTFERRCPILRTCSSGACIKELTGEQLFSHFNERGLLNSNGYRQV